MTNLETAARYLPENPSELSWHDLRRRAATCQACPLYKLGTQTVFGEGLTSARVVLVGEQPGDQEDKTGHPFVGPAGRLLDEALAALDTYLNDASLAGLDRVTVVHGSGTGALRDAVRTQTAGHALVKEIRAGEGGEGGDGVTVVTLG